MYLSFTGSIVHDIFIVMIFKHVKLILIQKFHSFYFETSF